MEKEDNNSRIPLPGDFFKQFKNKEEFQSFFNDLSWRSIVLVILLFVINTMTVLLEIKKLKALLIKTFSFVARSGVEPESAAADMNPAFNEEVI